MKFCCPPHGYFISFYSCSFHKIWKFNFKNLTFGYKYETLRLHGRTCKGYPSSKLSLIISDVDEFLYNFLLYYRLFAKLTGSFSCSPQVCSNRTSVSKFSQGPNLLRCYNSLNCMYFCRQPWPFPRMGTWDANLLKEGIVFTQN